MTEETRHLRAKVKQLEKDNERLRNALAPFACLGFYDIRIGDLNRARRVLNAIDNRKDT